MVPTDQDDEFFSRPMADTGKTFRWRSGPDALIGMAKLGHKTSDWNFCNREACYNTLLKLHESVCDDCRDKDEL